MGAITPRPEPTEEERQQAQSRHEELVVRGINSMGDDADDVIWRAVKKVAECRGASYGPYWDTVQMVLGALDEARADILAGLPAPPGRPS